MLERLYSNRRVSTEAVAAQRNSLGNATDMVISCNMIQNEGGVN